MKLKVLPFAIFLLGILLFATDTQARATTSQTNESGVQLTNEDIQNLRSLGFTEEEINKMGQEEFNLNKNLVGNVVDEEDIYLKVLNPANLKSKEPIIVEMNEKDFQQEVANEKMKEAITPYGDQDETDIDGLLRMTTYIIDVGPNSYRVKNSLLWYRIPIVRKIDVTGVGINSAFWSPMKDTQYGRQDWTVDGWCISPEPRSAVYNNSSDKYIKSPGGYALKINIPNNEFGGGCSREVVESLSSYMYYSVQSLAPSPKFDAYGQYIHQNKDVNITPSVSFKGFDISVSPADKYDKYNSTHASVNR